MCAPWNVLGLVIAALSFVMSCVTVHAQPGTAATDAVSGIVVDAESRAPVSGATVRAGGASAVTGVDGRFELARPAGRVVVEVEAAGFFPFSVEAPAGSPRGATSLEILLVRQSVVTDAVVVRGAGTDAAPATRVVEPVEVLRTPGALDNVFRALQVLPGVSATIEIGGYLSVRGGGPDQNLTLLDGVEVHDPYRMYGLVSAFNPETISRFDLASGGFSAKYGDRLSSMLTIDTRDGASHRRLGGSASLSVTDANVVTEGGFPKGSWLLSGRRTYYDAIAGLVSDQQFPGFTDVQGKATWAPRPATSVTAFVITSRQGGDLDIDDDELDAQVFDDTENDLAWARLQQTLGSRGHLRSLVAFSDTRVRSAVDANVADKGRRSNAPGDFDALRAGFRFGLSSRVRDVSTRHELGWTFGRHSLGTGLDVHHLLSSLNFELVGDRNPNAANGSSLQGGVGLPDRLISRLEHTRAASWLEATWMLGARATLQTGVRFDRVGLTDEFLATPRLSAMWSASPTTRLRTAYGHYAQSPGYEKLNQADYLLDLTDARGQGLSSQRARLISAGAEQDLPGGASLRVEAYYKRFGDVLIGRLETDAARQARIATYDFPAALAGSIPAPAIVTVVPGNDGRGRAYGVDVQVTRMRVPNGGRLRGWASYTWGKAERESYGLTFPFEYDRRHAATVVAAYQLSPRWEAATTARVASGFPRTVPLGLRVAGTADVTDGDGDGVVTEIVPERDADGRLVYTADFGGIENLQRGRLPFFARVDARLTWRPRSGRWEIYAEALNVLNRKNAGQLTPALEYDPTADRPRLVEEPAGWIPFLPAMGVRFRF